MDYVTETCIKNFKMVGDCFDFEMTEVEFTVSTLRLVVRLTVGTLQLVIKRLKIVG